MIVLLIVCFCSCNQKQKRDELVVESLKFATTTMEQSNALLSNKMQFKPIDYPTVYPIEFENGNQTILEVNSILKSFDESINRNESLVKLKTKYLKTIQSLTQLIDVKNKTVIKNFKVDELKLQLDSTFTYYDKKEAFQKQKMQFDIASICQKLYMFMSVSVEDYHKGGPDPEKTLIKTHYKTEEHYLLMFQKPEFCRANMTIKVDNITYGNKEAVPYHLYQNVSLLSFDSTLQTGNYDIYGKILYKLNDAPASFVEKKVRHTVKVD
jgi:hypothetical protein